MLTYVGLWNKIRNFFTRILFGGHTKENTKGKGNGVSRNIIRVKERYLRFTEVCAGVFGVLFVITLACLIEILRHR